MRKLFVSFVFMIGGIVSLSASTHPVQIDVDRNLCKMDKVDYPVVGFGTYPLTGSVCTHAVEEAIQAGYRIIDTATYYRNFDAIARALKNKDRHCLYLISKVWHDKQSPEDLVQDLETTLAALQTDYLDAYFLHWPNSQIPIEKTLTAMNKLKAAKKIRHIGLSNVSVNHVKRALEIGIPITWVQIEMHPRFCDFELLAFCHAHSIAVQAWAPLGRGRISQDTVLAEMGQNHGKTASQVALRWIIQHRCIPLPGSKDENHIRDNMDINDFNLTEEEMAKIDQLAKAGQRERFTKENVGFKDEFDFLYEECWPNNAR